MRILQIVTLIDPANSYGGPVRVAVNQSRALRASGHHVELIAGARGFDQGPPADFDGTAVRLFPARVIVRSFGFSGLVSPKMVWWLIRSLRSFDAVHIHLSRDLIVLPAALLTVFSRIPLFIQTHGMVDASPRRLAKILDMVATRHILRSAESLFALTDKESEDLQDVCSGLTNVVTLRNGVPLVQEEEASMQSPAARDSDDSSLEVLFMARLHAIKRPELFVAMAEALALRHPSVRFRLVGPDEGQGPTINEMIRATNGVDIEWEGAIAPSLTKQRMKRASILVLPSIHEVFPMTVIESMALGIPPVVTSSCGLAADITSAKAGASFDGTLRDLVATVDRLLISENYRREAGANARKLVLSHFSIDMVASHLEQAYLRGAIKRKSS